MKNLISIIIPVFNTDEEYLTKCLNSVINQKYKQLEIIIVDDGSRESTVKFLDNFSQKDPRIKIYHRKNHGVSCSRNFGIEHAKGDYISFIDADDYIDYDMYSDMVNDKYDLISSGIKYEKADGTVFDDTINRNKKQKIINNRNEAIINIFDGCLDASSCNKLYKLSLIKMKNLRFDEKIHSGEDMLFVFNYVKNFPYTYYINKSYYHYIKRESSVTNSKLNPKILTYNEAYESIINEIKDNNELLNLVQSRRAFTICKVLYKLIDTKYDKEIIIEHYNNLKSTKKYWKKCKAPSLRDAAIIRLMYYNPYLATRIWKIYKTLKKD